MHTPQSRYAVGLGYLASQRVRQKASSDGRLNSFAVLSENLLHRLSRLDGFGSPHRLGFEILDGVVVVLAAEGAEFRGLKVR